MDGEGGTCGGLKMRSSVARRLCYGVDVVFFFSSRRRHTRFDCDWSSDVCSSDLNLDKPKMSMMLDGPMGKRDVMAATSKGVSNARSFEVGDLPEAFEVEPNDEIGRASCRERV